MNLMSVDIKDRKGHPFGRVSLMHKASVYRYAFYIAVLVHIDIEHCHWADRVEMETALSKVLESVTHHGFDVYSGLYRMEERVKDPVGVLKKVARMLARPLEAVNHTPFRI